ncbi:hypothetical protein GGR50DRAFT_695804 [Xylaria sp. CBS 124048]|nr:hypothetical protein GGR50DRAFT_695804 [Xylaria sp. CBS 124048]
MSASQNDRANGSDPTSLPDLHEPEAHQTSFSSSTQAELAQAFRDLARGEQQAATIEANLTRLESKLEDLLASIEAGVTTKAPEDTNKDSKGKLAPAETK